LINNIWHKKQAREHRIYYKGLKRAKCQFSKAEQQQKEHVI